MNDENEEIIDEIKKASKFAYSKNVSIVDKLLNESWCKEDDLVVAYEDLKPPDDNRVILFFQIPFNIHLPDKWLKIDSEFGHPFIRFRNNNEGETTQVLISFQLWERRRFLYPLYVEGLINKQATVKTNLKASGILQIGEFELEVAKRLRLQAVYLLKEFIPIYKLTSKDFAAYSPDKLNNVFIMLKTGRLVIYSNPNEKLKENNRTKNLADSSKNFKNLQNFLSQKRPPSVYELYLIESMRLIGLEQYNLVVVQCVMILDWFANEILESYLLGELKKSLSNNTKLFRVASDRMWENSRNEHIRISTENKFSQYMPAIGVELPSELLKNLRNLIKQRNQIVHRQQANLVSLESAEDSLNTAMNVISFCLEAIIRKYDKKRN